MCFYLLIIGFWIYPDPSDTIKTPLVNSFLLLNFSNNDDVTDDPGEILLAEEDVDVVHQL